MCLYGQVLSTELDKILSYGVIFSATRVFSMMKSDFPDVLKISTFSYSFTFASLVVSIGMLNNFYGKFDALYICIL